MLGRITDYFANRKQEQEENALREEMERNRPVFEKLIAKRIELDPTPPPFQARIPATIPGLDSAVQSFDKYAYDATKGFYNEAIINSLVSRLKSIVSEQNDPNEDVAIKAGDLYIVAELLNSATYQEDSPEMEWSTKA
jgi:hypothetical protein